MSDMPTFALPGFTPWPKEFAQRYRELGLWTGDTLSDMFEQSCEKFAERTALVCGTRRWSYAELKQRVTLVVHSLQQRGLGAQDRVIVQMPNRAEFFVLCFALFRLGAIPVLAMPSHRQSEIKQFLETSDAKAWFLAARDGFFDCRDLVAQVCGGASARQASPQVFLLGEEDESAGHHRFEDLYVPQKANGELAPLPAGQAEQVALLQLSGGSTGVSKLIPRTHDDYLYSVRASAEICQLSQESVYLCVLPVAHNFPLSSPGTLGVFSVGGRVVLAHDTSPSSAFALIAKERVSLTALVPPLLQLWLQAKAGQDVDLSSLQVLQVGGARLAVEVAQRVRTELACQLQQVFGMAEGLVNYTRFDDSEELRLQTQGRAISPYDEIRVVDDQDRDLPDGEIGHLLTRGPYTIRGYYLAEQHNARAFTSDGFYRTGDLVRRMPSGHLQVAGRAKDQINRGGEKIAAQEVEAHLLAHPGVLDCALLAQADDFLGERSLAVVVLRKGGQYAGKDLSRFLHERGLAHYKIPDRYQFTSSLPKTAVGKIDKRQLQTMHQPQC